MSEPEPKMTRRSAGRIQVARALWYARPGQVELRHAPLPALEPGMVQIRALFSGVSRGVAIAATVSVILGAAYMLWLIQRLFYGPESQMTSRPTPDLRLNEIVALVPLALLMLVMGLAPSFWMPAIEKSATLPQVRGMIDLPRHPASSSNTVAGAEAGQ